MAKQKYVCGCIVVLLIGVLAWILSSLGYWDFAWIASIPAGILAIVLAVKINADSFEYKITRNILIVLGILLSVSFYFLFIVTNMVADISEGYVDKKIVVVAPTKGTIPIKAGRDSELDKNDNKERVVYFARTNCPACESFSEALTKAIKETKADVYYYNIEEMRKSEARKYVKQFKIKSAPVLMKIKNGKVINVLEKNRGVNKIKKFLK